MVYILYYLYNKYVGLYNRVRREDIDFIIGRVKQYCEYDVLDRNCFCSELIEQKENHHKYIFFFI